MELRFSGQFNRDIEGCSRKLSEAILLAIKNVKTVSGISEIQNLVKLKKYKIHYRIKVADHYRIGIIIRGNTVWFHRFGHRNIFYKKLFP